MPFLRSAAKKGKKDDWNIAETTENRDNARSSVDDVQAPTINTDRKSPSPGPSTSQSAYSASFWQDTQDERSSLEILETREKAVAAPAAEASSKLPQVKVLIPPYFCLFFCLLILPPSFIPTRLLSLLIHPFLLILRYIIQSRL